MITNQIIRIVYYLAALYDGVLGLAFLLIPAKIFNWFNVTIPNHWGYVQFPALMLIIFALMFLAIAVKPYANRNLIPYGILLKVAYSGTVFSYWFTIGIPGMWKPFAVIDLIFALIFIWSYFAMSSTDR